MTIVHQNEDHTGKASPLTAKLTKQSFHRHHNDTIHIEAGPKQTLDISFQRTVRVPDNKEENFLPPSLGTFPLYSAANFSETLTPEMAMKGGVFFPMYRK